MGEKADSPSPASTRGLSTVNSVAIAERRLAGSNARPYCVSLSLHQQQQGGGRGESGRFRPSTDYVASAGSCKRPTRTPEDPYRQLHFAASVLAVPL